MSGEFLERDGEPYIVLKRTTRGEPLRVEACHPAMRGSISEWGVNRDLAFRALGVELWHAIPARLRAIIS